MYAGLHVLRVTYESRPSKRGFCSGQEAAVVGVGFSSRLLKWKSSRRKRGRCVPHSILYVTQFKLSASVAEPCDGCIQVEYAALHFVITFVKRR